MMTQTTQPLRCVVYRTGGTDNFTWRRSVAMTPDEAIHVQRDMARMGYHSHIEFFARSMAVGLPETYEMGEGLI